MKRVVLLVLGFIWWWVLPSSVALAEDVVEHVDEPAVVNDVPNAWEEFKAVVDVLSPTGEAIYDVNAGAWAFGMSGSLYEFSSNSIRLGRLKAGYLSTNSFYGGADVDLPGLAQRYLSGKWSQLDTILGVLSKYGSTGVIIGYDVDAGQSVYGPTFGATLRF